MSVLNSLPKALDFGESCYKAGAFIGYLCRAVNYLGRNISITAATSKAPANLPFTYGKITGITDIIALHTRTLWLGRGKINANPNGNFLKFLEDFDIELSEKTMKSTGVEISCNALIESLIFEFGFYVEKYPHTTTVKVFPPFFLHSSDKSDLSGSELSDFVKEEKKALAIDDIIITFDEDDFIRGIRDGYRYE